MSTTTTNPNPRDLTKPESEVDFNFNSLDDRLNADKESGIYAPILLNIQSSFSVKTH